MPSKCLLSLNLVHRKIILICFQLQYQTTSTRVDYLTNMSQVKEVLTATADIKRTSDSGNENHSQ